MIKKLVFKMMQLTGYRFPEKGLFGRESKIRKLLYKVGIYPVWMNLKLDYNHPNP